MARGIQFQDFVYEIDNGLKGTPPTAVIASMLIKMDKFNIGTTKTKVKKSTIAEPLIAAHCGINLNKREFGVHARYLVCELLLTASSSTCYGTLPKRFVEIPILTLAQFNGFKAYSRAKGGTQADTTISVNHSQDGTTNADYRIIKKVSQELV